MVLHDYGTAWLVKTSPNYSWGSIENFHAENLPKHQAPNLFKILAGACCKGSHHTRHRSWILPLHHHLGTDVFGRNCYIFVSRPVAWLVVSAVLDLALAPSSANRLRARPWMFDRPSSAMRGCGTWETKSQGTQGHLPEAFVGGVSLIAFWVCTCLGCC